MHKEKYHMFSLICGPYVTSNVYMDMCVKFIYLHV